MPDLCLNLFLPGITVFTPGIYLTYILLRLSIPGTLDSETCFAAELSKCIKNLKKNTMPFIEFLASVLNIMGKGQWVRSYI